MLKRFSFLSVALVATLLSSAADASIVTGSNGTITAIMGTGLTDTNWNHYSSTGNIDPAKNIQLGLRAKQSFTNTYNNNMDGTYSFTAGTNWNFEWSITTDFHGFIAPANGGKHLNGLTYKLSVDFDPTAATDFVEFDPINLGSGWADHSIGDEATSNGAGQEATSASNYTTLITANTRAQNSWSLGMGFWNTFFGKSFNSNTSGTYTIGLKAYTGSTEIGNTSINVLVNAPSSVIPEPTSLVTFAGLMACGIGMIGRRRR